LVFKWKGEKQPPRRPVSREELELSLAEAVRACHPEFEAFAGVIVERVVPSAPGGANWAVKGVRYGAADRHRSGIILSYCVDEAQLKLELAEAGKAGPSARANPNP
jgi:hypothetical protein